MIAAGFEANSGPPGHDHRQRHCGAAAATSPPRAASNHTVTAGARRRGQPIIAPATATNGGPLFGSNR